MSEHCVAIEELERVLELPADDARRRHIESCARCRSLAGMLAEFASAAPAPVEAGFAAVDARLRETIAELTGVTEHEGVSLPQAPRESLREAPVAPRAPGWSFGALRPAFAFAALLVVASAGVALWRANAPTPVMRDASGPAAFTASASQAIAGAVQIAWTPVAGADGYRVVFLGPSLRELARLDSVSASPATLRADALPAGLAHGAEVAWQVEALAGTDVIATTPAQTLRVP